MVVRIVQNDQGLSLPPDLMAAAPSLSPRAEGRVGHLDRHGPLRRGELRPRLEVGAGPGILETREAWTPLLAFLVYPEITSSSRIDRCDISRPTVYDWLDDGQPNADNLSRIRTLLRLLSGSRVSASNPLFPRFVRSPHEPGGQPLLDLLCAETIDEAAATDAIRRAKALGDAMDSQREEREARLQSAGFEEPTGGLETE